MPIVNSWAEPIQPELSTLNAACNNEEKHEKLRNFCNLIWSCDKDLEFYSIIFNNFN